jgi:hypothetical protein
MEIMLEEEATFNLYSESFLIASGQNLIMQKWNSVQVTDTQMAMKYDSTHCL